MKAACHINDTHIKFVLSDVAPAYHQAVRDLGYSDVENEFCRTLPATSSGNNYICRNFQQYAEEMVLQTARVHVTPWKQALHAFLDRVEPHKLDWWIGGSAALAIRGLDVMPRDFDIVTDYHGAQQLGHILLNSLIEPVTQVDWFCSWWGRAFLYARIEWVGGVDDRADQPFVSDFGPTAARCLETIDWYGHPIRVPSLDLQLHVSQRRGLTDRVEQIMCASATTYATRKDRQ